jgi:hypothetical protein
MLYLRKSSASLPLPEPGIPLAGYATHRPLTSSHGDLSANFILLSDDRSNEVLLGSIDTLFVSRKLLEDIEKETQVSNMFLFSTHTHNAPSLAHELPLVGKVDPAWYSRVLEVLTIEIRTLRERKPIGVSVAYGEKSTTLNVNRRKYGYVLDYNELLKGKLSLTKKTSLAPNADGQVDSRIRLFAFDSGTDTHTILWSFAAHPAFYPEPRAASADFPGLIRQKLQALYGIQCCIIYVPGLAGSAIPRMRQRLVMRPSEFIQRLFPFHPMLPSTSRNGYRKWVAALFEAVRETHEDRQIVSKDGALTVRNAFVPEIFDDLNSGRCIGLSASYLGFGEGSGILAYSGEMLGEWWEHLGGLPLERVIASGYAGGDCLYVPPSEQLPRGGYEVDGFQHCFSLKGSFRRDITDRVVGATKRLLSDDQKVQR